MMLHVMALIRFQEQHAEPVCAAMAELAVNSRKEPGCIRYEVFRRAGEAVLMTQETWADAAAEQAHMKGANLAATVAKIGTLLAAAPEIHHYSQIA
jgi:quinol monooxygenase YgiN